MKSGEQRGGLPAEYGEKISAFQTSKRPSLWTRLNGNGIISTRLTRALGLKDPPGMPPMARMGEVQVVADMMQGGFAAYTSESGKVLSTGTPSPLGLGVAGGQIVGPTDRDPYFNQFGANLYFPFAGPIIKNNDKDARINNALVEFIPTAANINPSTDTNPQSLKTFFLLNGVPVFVQTQNNLVSSAADNSFISQTSDSYWNGIVPAGSFFSWIFIRSDGLTGLSKAFDVSDAWGVTVSLLSAPSGTILPGH